MYTRDFIFHSSNQCKVHKISCYASEKKYTFCELSYSMSRFYTHLTPI